MIGEMNMAVSALRQRLDKRNIRSAEERADIDTGFGNGSRKELILFPSTLSLTR